MPLAKRWHLARERSDPRTFCGREFSDGFDEIEDECNHEEEGGGVCQTCRAIEYRRYWRDG